MTPVFYDIHELLYTLLAKEPQAAARLRGSGRYPDITGEIQFHPFGPGTLLTVRIGGLPSASAPCGTPFFGFHIHEGSVCSGNASDPFADAGVHLNPGGCPHPQHLGDLPPVMGCRGNALSVLYTDRFSPGDVTGHTLILHRMPDDFTTQPSGNSGEKIACGEIRKTLL